MISPLSHSGRKLKSVTCFKTARSEQKYSSCCADLKYPWMLGSTAD